MKKNIYCALFFLFPAIFLNAQPVQLNNYEQLMDALTGGYRVSAVIHYGDCKLVIDGQEEEAPDAIGGIELGAFEHFARGCVRNEKAYVSASENVLIGHPRYGFVFNYAKIRVYEDNTVEIVVRYLDPTTYEVKMDETFHSIINAGGEGGAVYFFMQ